MLIQAYALDIENEQGFNLTLNWRKASKFEWRNKKPQTT
jgi:hypothetical protein